MKIRIEKFEIEIPSDWTERLMRSVNEGEYQRDVAAHRAEEQRQGSLKDVVMQLLPMFMDALDKLFQVTPSKKEEDFSPFAVDPNKAVNEDDPFNTPTPEAVSE